MAAARRMLDKLNTIPEANGQSHDVPNDDFKFAKNPHCAFSPHEPIVNPMTSENASMPTT